MADPHRLRNLPPRFAGYRRLPVRGWRRAWLQLRFDPRIRQMALAVLGTVLVCHLSLALSTDGGRGPVGAEGPDAMTAQTLDALFDSYSMGR